MGFIRGPGSPVPSRRSAAPRMAAALSYGGLDPGHSPSPARAPLVRDPPHLLPRLPCEGLGQLDDRPYYCPVLGVFAQTFDSRVGRYPNSQHAGISRPCVGNVNRHVPDDAPSQGVIGFCQDGRQISGVNVVDYIAARCIRGRIPEHPSEGGTHVSQGVVGASNLKISEEFWRIERRRFVPSTGKPFGRVNLQSSRRTSGLVFGPGLEGSIPTASRPES